MRYKDYDEFSPSQMEGRFARARIPLPLYKVYLDDVRDVLNTQSSPGVIEGYFTNLLEGRVLRAEGYRKTCGKGLWIVGTEAPLVAAAVLQESLLAQSIKEALFLDAHDYIESKKPDGEDEYREKVKDVDLLVLTDVSGLTEWGRGLIYQVTRIRYWQGLPTIIADDAPLQKDLCYRGSMVQVQLKEVG